MNFWSTLTQLAPVLVAVVVSSRLSVKLIRIVADRPPKPTAAARLAKLEWQSQQAEEECGLRFDEQGFLLPGYHKKPVKPALNTQTRKRVAEAHSRVRPDCPCPVCSDKRAFASKHRPEDIHALIQREKLEAEARHEMRMQMDRVAKLEAEAKWHERNTMPSPFVPESAGIPPISDKLDSYGFPADSPHTTQTCRCPYCAKWDKIAQGSCSSCGGTGYITMMFPPIGGPGG